jgi:hypothetical protein
MGFSEPGDKPIKGSAARLGNLSTHKIYSLAMNMTALLSLASTDGSLLKLEYSVDLLTLWKNSRSKGTWENLQRLRISVPVLYVNIYALSSIDLHYVITYCAVYK